MRAVVLQRRQLEVREMSEPAPREGEILLRTLSTAICASDIHYMDHPAAPDTPSVCVWDADREVVMGHEFVGEVVAHGPGCSDRFPVGSRVTAMPALIHQGEVQVIGGHPDAIGSFGEMFCVSERLARHVPDHVDPDAVALCDAFAVGEGYVSMSGIEPGQLPLVIGAGAIGLSTVAALAARGIDPIVISDYNRDRLGLAATFGSVIAVDASEQNVMDAWRQAAKGRRGVSAPYVFECVGKRGLLQQLVEEGPSGTRIYASGGWYDTGDTIDVLAATTKGALIQFGGAPSAETWYGTLDAIVEGRLDPRPSIGMVIGLDEVPEAIALARSAQGPPRIVVHPWKQALR
jgi:threonine dehydrogenase-like Zn-dependent dehydrogenase